MIIIFMISYYMAALIMNVFQTVSVTLLQCVYIDLDLSAQAHQDVSAGARPEEIELIIEALRISNQIRKTQESAMKRLMLYEEDES